MSTRLSPAGCYCTSDPQAITSSTTRILNSDYGRYQHTGVSLSRYAWSGVVFGRVRYYPEHFGTHLEAAQGFFLDSRALFFGELGEFETVVGTFLVLGARDVPAFVLGYGAWAVVQRVFAVHYVQDFLRQQLPERTLFFVGFHRVRKIL